jgi:uncharacterized protein (DUF2141 family)
MKHLTISLALLALSAVQACAADLTIHVDGVRRSAGQVTVAVYNSADSYLKTPLKSAAAVAVEGRTTVMLADLPAGEYAFAVVHDANGNGKMDRNLLGMPKEDYAFSNNAVGKMGPASFTDARFTLPASGAAVHVTLKN